MQVGVMSLVHRALLRRGELIFDGHLRRELIALVIRHSHGARDFTTNCGGEIGDARAQQAGTLRQMATDEIPPTGREMERRRERVRE